MSEQAQAATPPGSDLIIRLAWSSVMKAIRKMAWIFMAASVLNVLASAALHWLTAIVKSWAASGILARPFAAIEVGIIGLIAIFLSAAIAAPVAVAVHRFIILDEVTSKARACLAERVWRFAFWEFGLALALGLLAGPMVFAGNFVVILISMIALVYISLRLSFVFPAIAVDAPFARWTERLKESWRQTRGHLARLFFAMLVTLLPVILIEKIPYLVSFLDWSRDFVIRGVDGTYSPFSTAMVRASEVLEDGLVPVEIGLAAAVASWTYLWVIENQAKPDAAAAK